MIFPGFSSFTQAVLAFSWTQRSVSIYVADPSFHLTVILLPQLVKMLRRHSSLYIAMKYYSSLSMPGSKLAPSMAQRLL